MSSTIPESHSLPVVTDVSALRSLMLSDNGFAFDPASGLTFTLSETGVELVRYLIDGLSPEQVVFRWRERYETSERMLRDDCDAFLKSLARLNLIQLGEPS